MAVTLRPPLWVVAVSLLSVVAGAAGCTDGTQGPSGGTHSPPQYRAAPRHQHVLYVDGAGNDGADGSQKSPLRTITAAISHAHPGDSIVVQSGVYHESLKIEAHPGLTVSAAPGAKVWLDGSRPIDSWVKKRHRWVTNWAVHFDDSKTYTWGAPDNTKQGWQFVNPARPMAAHPDQVWIDGVRQVQVATRGEVRPGAFFVDEDKQRLYLGSDPTDHEVRASSLTKAVSIRSRGVTLRGINVRRFAPSVPHMGAVTIAGPDVSLQDLTISENATTGLHTMARRTRLLGVRLVDNGMIGMTATRADDLVLDQVMVEGNNVEGFNTSPVAGGAKIGRTRSVVIRDSEFVDNHGTGVWLDESSYDVGIVNSQMIGNGKHGISVEVSGRIDLVGNLLVDNRGNGIKINDTSDAQIWNNTVVGNQRAINIVQDGRDLDPSGTYRDPRLPLPWQIRNIAVRNNVMSGSSGDTLLGVEDFTGRFSAVELDVTALGNLYHRPDPHGDPRWIVVWSRGAGDPYAFKGLAPFRKTAMQELPGALLSGGSVVQSDLSTRPAVHKIAAAIAQPLPSALAERVGQPTDERQLGAWITRP
ncbi:MAG TPA: right-handed parallel beta-helix repeat-containing protein, partial [Microlunatus sp.]